MINNFDIELDNFEFDEINETELSLNGYMFDSDWNDDEVFLIHSQGEIKIRYFDKIEQDIKVIDVPQLPVKINGYEITENDIHDFNLILENQ